MKWRGLSRPNLRIVGKLCGPNRLASTILWIKQA
jgi:hypothetical protein